MPVPRPRPAHRYGLAAAVEGSDLEGELHPELHAVGARDRDPRLPRHRRSHERATACARPTDVARQTGLRVGSAGTHLFSLFEKQRITARDRYRALVDQLQYVARRELIFGMHVHVSVDDAEKAVGAQRHARPPTPSARAQRVVALLARSATGLASTRQLIFAASSPGPPPRFRDYATTRASSASSSARAASPTTPTSGGTSARTHGWARSIRICDAVTRVEDAIAIAAFCQSLVKLYCERFERGEEIQSYHRILTSENKRLAARYGLDAPLMDLATGRRNRVPVGQLIRRTLRDVEPHAKELGCDRELAGIREILAARRRAPAADLQREPRHRRGRARSPTRPSPRRAAA